MRSMKNQKLVALLVNNKAKAVDYLILAEVAILVGVFLDWRTVNFWGGCLVGFIFCSIIFTYLFVAPLSDVIEKRLPEFGAGEVGDNSRIPLKGGRNRLIGSWVVVFFNAVFIIGLLYRRFY